MFCLYQALRKKITLGDFEDPKPGDYFFSLRALEGYPKPTPMVELVGMFGTESGAKVRHTYEPGVLVGPARRGYRGCVGVMETEDDGTQTKRPHLMSFIAVISASPRPEDRGKESYILLTRATSAAPGELIYAEQHDDFAPGRTWSRQGLQDQTSHASASDHPEPGESEEIAGAKDQGMLQNLMEAHERSMGRQKIKLEAKTTIQQSEAKAQQVKKVTFKVLEAEPSKVLGEARSGGPPGPGQQQISQLQPVQQAPHAAAEGPLNAAALAAAPPSIQKQMIGEKLFPAISRIQPALAGKITGMMLELDNSELLILLESEQQLKKHS